MTLSHKLIEELLRKALLAYPRECCGILVSDNECFERFVEIPNRSETPHRFRITGKDLKGVVEKNSPDQLAFYHSHPFDYAIPSSTDRLMAQEMGITNQLILSLLHSPQFELRGYRCVDEEWIEDYCLSGTIDEFLPD